jgi:hypothetical protein
MEHKFQDKIELIIEKDMRELFGDDEESSLPVRRKSTLSPGKPEMETALPPALYEVMSNMTGLAVENPYTKFVAAIEVLEDRENKNAL